MKKYIIHIFSLAIITFLLASCSNNFDANVVHQGGEILPEQMDYNQIALTLDNIYNHLPNGYDIDFDGALFASATDEAVNSSLSSPINTFHNGTWGPTKTFNEGYNNFYTGIRKTNKFLDRIDDAPVIPLNPSIDRDSTITRMKGEAYFLRAYFHFELFKRYGPIILATKVLDPLEDQNIPRSPLAETIEQISKDCDLAAESLPEWNPDHLGEIGRVTKVAALALKSRLYLYAASPLYNPSNDISKWQDAADAAKAVIDLDLAQLHNNYENISNYSTSPYNDEVILATKADNVNSIELNNAPISYDGAKGRTNPTQELVDAFEMDNGVPITDPASGYDPEDPYSNRDPRLAMTIFYNGSMFKGSPVETYVGGKDGLGRSINATKTGYYMRKFLSENAIWNTTADAMVRRSWVLIRYAEVLLNYAEALNEAQGPVEDVYTYVNMVRDRVDMPDLPQGLTQDEMRKRIHNERRVELVFEGHRFYDVRRWKKGEEYFDKPVTGMRITVNNSGVPIDYERFQVQNRIFEEKYYFYPFPQYEINLNTELTQNPGW